MNLTRAYTRPRIFYAAPLHVDQLTRRESPREAILAALEGASMQDPASEPHTRLSPKFRMAAVLC